MKTLASALGMGTGSGGFLSIGKIFGLAQGGLVHAYADGGSVWGAGTATSDSIPAYLSAGKYDAINGGSGTQQRPQGGFGSGGRQMHVEVHNYGSSSVQVQPMTENRVRLIVRDEAPRAVAEHAPAVIASDLANPNSKTSKAMSRNVTPSRVR